MVVRTVFITFVLSGLLSISAVTRAEDTDLRKVLDDEHARGTDLWIYNDLDEAMKVARKEGKPIFVTFRCVPCKACAGFDATVAQGSEEIDRLARERFVSIRQVEMKGVDLSLFQFDYDLNWAAMFINADGVVYARYGTQSAAGPDAYNSVEGLLETMRRVLELHEAYPGNLAELKGKRGPDKPYKTAIEMPGLERREKLRGPTERSNCIHCHNIHDAENLQAQRAGAAKEDYLWRYPLPDNIGLVIDPDEGNRIERVLPGSPAVASGLQAGELVTHAGGQAITSIADIQWVLHNLPNEDTTVEIRGSRSGTRKLSLSAGWKRSNLSWRGSLWSIPPRLRVWAPSLDDEGRRKHKVAEDDEAYLVRWINGDEAGGRAAKEAGLREGDVIIALDGKPLERGLRPNEFNMRIKLRYEVGDVLPLTVLREGERKEIRIKLAE